MKLFWKANRKGLAAIATMVLLLFLAAMLATVLRANALDRRQELFLRDQYRARAIAERGVSATLMICDKGTCAGETHEAQDDYRLDISWSPSEPAPETILIHSEVQITRGEYEPVHIALNVQAAPSAEGLRIISWSEN